MGLNTQALNNQLIGANPQAICDALKALGDQVILDLIALGGGAVPGVPPARVTDLATTAALPTGTYSASAKTFTVTATGTLTIDGQVTTLGQRILVNNQATPTQNGLFVVTTAGAGGVQAVLTRVADMNVTADFQPGMLVQTSGLGTTNPNALYVFTAAAGFVLDTNNATFAKIATLNEFQKAVSLQAPQAVASSTDVAEFIAGMFSGTGNITAAYYVPFAVSTPASGSNSQTMTLQRYSALGVLAGTVASAVINNANPTVQGARFTLGTITNGTWADGDILTAKSAHVGTAVLPAGIWVVVGTPN